MAQIDDPITIDISRRTYDRLQSRAVPFEDTPDTIIQKLLDATEPKGGRVGNGAGGQGSRTREAAKATPQEAVEVVVRDPLRPPSLKHTKILRAEVNGEHVLRANWNAVRHSVLSFALTEAGLDLREMLRICAVNALEGVKDDEGYTYYPELGLSIQGQNAENAWQVTAVLAKELAIPVKVWFQWRPKPAAERPGQRGLLTVG